MQDRDYDRAKELVSGVKAADADFSTGLVAFEQSLIDRSGILDLYIFLTHFTNTQL